MNVRPVQRMARSVLQQLAFEIADPTGHQLLHHTLESPTHPGGRNAGMASVAGKSAEHSTRPSTESGSSSGTVRQRIGPRLCALAYGVLLSLALTACGGSSENPEAQFDTVSELHGIEPVATHEQARADIEQQMRDVLNAYDTTTPFTLALESFDGASFTHSVSDSSELTRYDSASTAKWVTAAVILHQIDAGLLSLEDNPQDYLSFWPTTGPLSDITLRQLLSFTSGLGDAPACISDPFTTLRECVQQLALLNNSDALSPPAGSAFVYGPAHMQVAGLMTVEALALESWQQVFDLFKTTTNLFLGASYDFPSLRNPRLAGGMNWTAQEYMAFLSALVSGAVLSDTSRQAMFTDQLTTAEIVFSPSQNSLGEDWHYGLGVWLECDASFFNCGEAESYSSPGAFGAYPFINFEQRVFGILARQGAAGTFVEGRDVLAAVAELVRQWSAVP